MIRSTTCAVSCTQNDEEEDLKAKRKSQNRNAQRRFRHRKKRMEGAYLNQTGEEQTIQDPTSRNWTITDSTWHVSPVSETTPSTSQLACQTFDDISLNNVASGYGETFLDSSQHIPHNDWLRRLSMFSSPTARDMPSNTADHCPSSAHHEFDQLILDTSTTSPTIFHSDSAHGFTSTQGTGLPHSTSPNPLGSMAKRPHSANSAPEDSSTLFDITQPNHLTNTAPSSYADATQRPHHTQSASITESLSDHNFSGLRAGRKKKATCCVAHKAEMMISEVQKLCKFGARFGLLKTEDKEVQDCLGFLKTRLHDTAQCPNGDVFYCSSSDGESD